MNKRLERIPDQGKIAGVCAGLAVYFDTDVALVRAAWVLLSLVPGALVGGVIAYVAAWVLMPAAAMPSVINVRKRIIRPHIGRKVGGVCAGLANYYDVDVTVVRLLWVVLSIYPGAIVLGAIAYVIAWFIIPAEPHAPMQPAPQPL
jgi:phage shock protein PspC (stress-responsive transcriptional regulator)